MKTLSIWLLLIASASFLGSSAHAEKHAAKSAANATAKPAAKAADEAKQATPEAKHEPVAVPSPVPTAAADTVEKAAPTPTTEVVAKPEEEKTEPYRFRQWGATVSLNIPHPIFGEAEYRLTPIWSFGLGGGGLAVNNLTIGSNPPFSINMTAFDGRFRWHPWGGSFFMGLVMGYQQLSGSSSKPISITSPAPMTVDTKITANINALYVTPHLGWFWIFKSGFTMGFDFGVQVPVSPGTSFDISTSNADLNSVITQLQATQEYKDLQSSVDSSGKQLGRIPLPYVTALRLGWMF